MCRKPVGDGAKRVTTTGRAAVSVCCAQPRLLPDLNDRWPAQPPRAPSTGLAAASNGAREAVARVGAASSAGWRPSATNWRCGCRWRWARGSRRGSCCPMPRRGSAGRWRCVARGAARAWRCRARRTGGAGGRGRRRWRRRSGCALIWWRAEQRRGAGAGAAGGRGSSTARVERVEPLPARELVRLTLAPDRRAGGSAAAGARQSGARRMRRRGWRAARRSGCARG